MRRMPRFIVALAALVPAASQAEPVLLISIDGLQPADVIEAEKRGINIPNLKRFVKEGSYASGVTGVLPSVTYPSHATLVTGKSPAEHGIVGNTGFDPMQINQSGWYWYASDYKVPTLWDAAAKAGLKTANVHWPVTVGQNAIRYNLPQIWRTGHEDDVKLMKVLATPGLVDKLEASLGVAYAQGIDESIAGDENRARFAEALILSEKPDFMTAYFTALDHEQHEKGPDTKDAHQILERIDAIVGKLVAAQLKVHPDAVIAIASDHGFAATTTEINLYRAFIDAGLMMLGADGKIKEWQAAPWNSGGSSAIMLADPADESLVARVEALLKKLKFDPANRIAAIADRNEIAQMGGNPKASFYVNFEFGAYGGGFKGKDAPLVSASGSKGTHGYFQSGGNMRSSFLIMGKGVTAGKNLGEIDMRSIAPMLADKLGVALR
ncbi:MAG TPA: ectonucleotide pyrophosphatase/phosphodiesterase [Sphingorhabdus sp.]|uniref:alkaline phosphatase family protein n=1 Tax=Sphingorhabdus sp. TaxID=1902408 RepID=UPI002B70CA48|nr:ectonucleotide pyrophosphatase/phosphodiesterase [Sphingorhabdus sp.]HMT40032.1 ectonucleotide pyrophosphatase/phosphodiesterase [Sphingorhabdus sp.]HMU21167.1 ectonucleotide pyrophosphatase/phosphodiesterase [Sphingorhabdus sp.]